MNKPVFYYPYDKSFADLLNETYTKATGQNFGEVTEPDRFDETNSFCQQFLSEIGNLDFLSKINLFQHIMNEYFSLVDASPNIEQFLGNPIFNDAREFLTHCAEKDSEEDVTREVVVDYNEQISYVLLPEPMTAEECEKWIANFESNN